MLPKQYGQDCAYRYNETTKWVTKHVIEHAYTQPGSYGSRAKMHAKHVSNQTPSKTYSFNFRRCFCENSKLVVEGSNISQDNTKVSMYYSSKQNLNSSFLLSLKYNIFYSKNLHSEEIQNCLHHGIF
jgi:hypothetical protein